MADANPFDQFDKAAPRGGGNPFDQFDSIKAAPDGSYKGADADSWFSHSAAGRVLSAFGHGIQEGWGEDYKLSDDTVKELRSSGVFNDYQTGRTSLVRSFN